MEKAAKEKFLSGIAQKYKKADRSERSTLLDQIVSKLGIHRKSAIRALRQYLGSSGSKKKASKKRSKKR